MSKQKKRNDWFNEYHEIPQLGIEGKRALADRLQYYHVEDFNGASVIDLGCNMGQMSFQAADWGSTRVTGVEYDCTAIRNARAINKELNLNIEFVVDDLDSNFFWNSLDSYDVVMFLSVIDTKELENRYGILSKACMKTNKVMYFEGHGKQSASKYMKNIVDYTDFTQIKYYGNTPTNRPFFRCTRDKLSSDECVQKILESNYNKIAVVGKSFAGKTTIREMLQKEDTDYTIIDDLKHHDNGVVKNVDVDDLQKFEKFVLFDYRALEYYNNFDVVFFITPDGSLIGQSRKEPNPIKSPAIKDFNNLKEVYTVESYKSPIK
jgi:SAM-dependent methyltransferase